MVKFFPERQDIAEMKPPPTEGEQFLLNFLEKYLGGLNGDFEVFFQAHWDGGFPDVVVLRKNHGILIIEVKDWNLDSYAFQDEWTWIVKSTHKALKSPTAQVKGYKDLFYNTYSRTLAEENLRNAKAYSLIQSAVFFYGSAKMQVARIPNDDFVIFLTQEELEQNGLKNIPSKKFLLGDHISTFFKDDIYSELCRVLKPSEHSLSKIFFPEKLSAEQRRLAQSAANSTQQIKRQLRAPAGSGKTTVLAFRAVDAYRKTNAPVLILTYNITLCNYIHDCISQALNSVPNIEGRKGKVLKTFFIIRHFHGFIKTYRNESNQLDIEKTNEEGKHFDTYELEDTPQKFQTIFVDETQDFQRGWMETIVSLLATKGELIFFGDWDQDLYQVRQMENVPTGRAGILKLKSTYRLRSKILELARAFQIKFFKGSVGNELEAPPISENLFGEFADEVTTFRYHYLHALDVNVIVEIFESVIKEYKIPNDDVCILSQVIRNVRSVDKALRDKGYKTITTFEMEEDWQKFHNTDKDWKIDNIRQAAKYNFWMESGKIKLATIQSYKGWGIHTEILIIGTGFVDEKFLNAEMVYTGITRAKKNLVVINIGDKTYDEFFRTETEKLSAEPQLTDAEKIALAKKIFSEAGRLFKNGDHEGATKLLTKAIELNPNFDKAYYNRGNAYQHLQQYERAIKDYDKAIHLNSVLSEAYSNRGNAYQHLKQYGRAVQDYTKCIEIKPNDVKAYCNRGNAYGNLEQYAQAIQDYDKAIGFKPNEALFYNNRGIVYKNWGQYARAIQDFGKALELSPDYADAYEMLGKCFKALGGSAVRES